MTTLALPAPGSWVEHWLSPARFSVYLASAGDDRTRALALYEWNAALTGSVLRDLAHFEVGLRNSYATALDGTWSGGGHWLQDPASPLRAPLMRTRGAGVQVDVNRVSRQKIDEAYRKLGQTAAPGQVIAELSFGFWRYTSAKAREKTLWLPHLHHAFPTPTDRAELDGKISKLNDLRNRAAHHEPLLAEPVAQRTQDIVDLARLLCPDLGAYIEATSRTASLLPLRP
ncbi:hypothetical protein [Kitasatospora sp. NPDC059599]|uniref:hypothetical protein n=1 Tax=Kitasatospora sp. NPDC059599 TaxID=3346880 RepID=UPI00369CBDF1